MKKWMIQALLLLVLLFIPTIISNAQTVEYVEEQHTFKISFSHPVKLSSANKAISFQCDGCSVAYSLRHGAKQSIIELIPEQLQQGYTYTLTVSNSLQNQYGKPLKALATKTFHVVTIEEKLAPLYGFQHSLFLDYSYKRGQGIHIYGSPSTTVSTIQSLAKAFDEQLKPFYVQYFPNASTAGMPVVVVIGNDNDEMAYRKAGGLLLEDIYAGWFYARENDIIIRHDIVNENLLAHEYLHWFFYNGYEQSVIDQMPPWVEEGLADLFSEMYSANETDPFKIPYIRQLLQQLDYHVDETALTTSYSAESVVALAMLLREHGYDSLHPILVAASSSSLATEWQKTYGISFLELIQYTYKGLAHYRALNESY